MGDFSEYIELIDKYLSGNMSEDEKKRFESRMSEDKNLQQMFDDTKLIEIGIKNIEREKILEKVKEVANEFKDEEVPIKTATITRKLLIRNLSVAASILIIVSLSIVFYLQNNTASYLSDFTPYTGYEALPFQPRAIDDPLIPLNKAWDFYNSKLYSNSLEIIINTKDVAPFEAEFSFLKGLCLIEEKQYEATIESFKLAAADARFRYKDDARWYLGLTYLEIGNKEDAKKVLSQINNPNEEVKKILDEID